MRAQPSEVEVQIRPDWTPEVVAVVSRTMHLNPPLPNDEVKLRKKTSWHNVSAQETRAEAINAVEAKLGRRLSWTEIDTIMCLQQHADGGIITTLTLQLDKENISE